MSSELERRTAVSGLQVRSNARTAATIVGYAALYGHESTIGGQFRERIAPGAFRSVLASGPDVRALFNHDERLVLGRTVSGTLRLSEDSRGLRYEFDVNPNDSQALSVAAQIRRGDVSQSSYSFRVKDGGDEWTYGVRGELPLRTIRTFAELRDVSPVTFPAVAETSAEARSRARVGRSRPAAESAQDRERRELELWVAREEVALLAGPSLTRRELESWLAQELDLLLGR